MKLRITVVGTGYEGLTIATGLAVLGHKVTAFDTNASRARRYQRGMGVGTDTALCKHMKQSLQEGMLTFTSEPESSLTDADIVVLAGIPGHSDDEPINKTGILRAAECLTGAIASFNVVMVTAKVPSGSCRLLQEWLDDALYTGNVHVMASPVFFSEPEGLKEFLHPERLVLGYNDEHARRTVDEVYAPILMEDTDVFHVSWEAAEMMRAPASPVAPAVPAFQELERGARVPSLSGSHTFRRR